MNDNELIAKFMGLKLHREVFGGSGSRSVTYWMGDETLYPSEMKYDTSWDWLMPVVEKIRRIYADSEHDSNISRATEWLRAPLFAHCSSPPVFTHMNVVEFIKWHNEQTKVSHGNQSE